MNKQEVHDQARRTYMIAKHERAIYYGNYQTEYYEYVIRRVAYEKAAQLWYNASFEMGNN